MKEPRKSKKAWPIWASGLSIAGLIGCAWLLFALEPVFEALQPIFVASETGPVSRADFEARYLAAESMAPTLRVGNRILVDKTLYRSEPPSRGDIILFGPTQNLREQGFDDDFLKRVIGLPGETIEVRAGKIYIGGQPLEEGYITEPPNYEWGPVQIPAGSYAGFGDNRNNSYDSYYWGFVPENLIIGKVVSVFWPPEKARSL